MQAANASPLTPEERKELGTILDALAPTFDLSDSDLDKMLAAMEAEELERVTEGRRHRGFPINYHDL